ncbi:MAG TPA: hypothetical protein VGI47_02915 [Candidatus Binataceae bacterium]|jgi:hypothetical protein
MPDLGNRSNVMGPQPIGSRVSTPEGALEAYTQIADLLARGDRAALQALAMPQAAAELAALASDIAPGRYDKREIIGTAHIIQHWYFKARIAGPGLNPVTFQIRLGENDGRWMIWEAADLSGRRSAWTK